MSLKILDTDQLPLVPAFEGFRQNRPDTCLLAGQSRCGVWFGRSDSQGERYGVIGHYWAEDSQQSLQLLTTACDLLRENGCATVYGPMDGNTWKPYRFVTWSDGSPPFLMEPQHPPQWPQFWLEAGFTPRHEYLSTITHDLATRDERLVEVKARLAEAGITWQQIDLGHFGEELAKIYRVSLETFSQNVLYTGIDQPTFLQQYLPFADHVDPRYVLLAHDKGGDCCGFLFAIPDLLQLKQGKPLDRLIIKTFAVRASIKRQGLVSVLVDEIRQTARQNGFSSVITAFMHSGNVSTKVGRNNVPLRRYTLFARTLS